MWAKLQETQKTLDERIIKERGLDPKSRYFKTNMILALKVELAEYANETRCFKQWSSKAPAEKEIRLEEAADALHFYLHIANDMKISLENFQNDCQISTWSDQKETLTFYINKAMDYLAFIKQPDQLTSSLKFFITAAAVDGFTLEDLERAYYRKNQINHKRQDQGY